MSPEHPAGDAPHTGVTLNVTYDADSHAGVLLAAAPWLTLGPYEDECRRSDDALDA